MDSVEPFGLVPFPTSVSCAGEGEEAARSPVLRMIEPSDLERIKVDCTPGLDERRERFSRIAAGYIASDQHRGMNRNQDIGTHCRLYHLVYP